MEQSSKRFNATLYKVALKRLDDCSIAYYQLTFKYYQ